MNLLEQRMEDAHNFLKSTWSNEDNPRYRVYMAQKCLNLNEYYFIQEICSEQGSDKNKEFVDVRRKTFLSQYALLLKADEWVDYYAARKEFPRICVVDELILTGHDFGSLMYRMLDVIFDAWQSKYGEIGPEEYWVIRDAFIKSVSYRVYARSKDAPLLDQSLPSIGDPRMLDKSECSMYTANIVELLNETTVVENTSFIPSLWLSKTEYENIFHSSNEYLFGWNSTVWSYGKIQAEIWQKDLVGSGTDVRFHLAFVCVKKRAEADQEEIVCVTPYVFWGKLQDPALDKLFANIADVLRRQDSKLWNPLAEICKVPYRAATNSKLRFLYTLICILELSELTQTPINTLRNDLEKVAQSFGTIEQIYPALKELCAQASETVRKQLRAAIYRAMWDAPALDPDAAAPDNGDTHDHVGCLKAAEEYFIQVDRLECQQTKVRRDEGRTFIPSSNFFYAGGCLSHYFKQLAGHYSLEEKIAALVLLAQANVVTLTMSAQGGDAFYAKVGEATIGAALYADCSIRRMAVYIPALVVLERVCKKMDLTMKYWAERFGAFLEKKSAEEGLERRFRVFVESAYSSGDSMEDYQYVKGNERDPNQAELYRRQVYYQEQVAVFFRES